MNSVNKHLFQWKQSHLTIIKLTGDNNDGKVFRAID